MSIKKIFKITITWKALLPLAVISFFIFGYYSDLVWIFFWLGLIDFVRFVFEKVFPNVYQYIIENNKKVSSLILLLVITFTIFVVVYWFYFIK